MRKKENVYFLLENVYLMFFALFFCGKSATSADLLPPYYLTSNNISGSWQFSGGSIIQEDYVILVPPIQYYKGCAWSIIPPPSKDWLIYFHLNITVETGGGGFGIWLIESHGADGPFYGGPTNFTGVALIGALSDSSLLKLKLIESRGNETFSMFDSKSDDFDYVYNISNESIILCMNVFTSNDSKNGTFINISFLDDQFTSTEAVSRRINVSLARAWLGITASNDDKTSKIILSAARFSIFDPFVAMQHGRQKHVSIRITSPHMSPDTMPSTLRNPSFMFTKSEILSYKGEKGQISDGFNSKKSDDVLRVIDECNAAFNDVAQYKNLNGFLRQTIVPYAQSWQKRTFKIISASKNASEFFTDCFNKTKSLLFVFNQSIVSTIQKADSKIGKLNDLLFENIVEYAAANQRLNSEVVEQTLIWWISVMKYVAVVEVLAVAAFFCFQSRLNKKI